MIRTISTVAAALTLLPAILVVRPASAVQEEGGRSTSSAESAEAEEPRRDFTWSVEAKAHYRNSASSRFGVPFPPGDDQWFMETVNPGSHVEVSTLTLFLDGRFSPGIVAHAKVDFVDLYDRNPTSGDRQVDVDEAWIRFGRETEPALLPPRPGIYAKVGKMPKFERQDDRHLESYGLVSTAFNRFEDLGLEIGADLGRHVYVKASATQGNPVFLRDPNALAGDNGVEELRDPDREPPLASGIPILYDAEVEGIDVDGDLELGAGLGIRWASAGGRRGADLLIWGFERELAETVDLEGTFYGGDLDLLRGPGNAFPFPIEGNDKSELGANLWLYVDALSLFLQYVDQDLAGLQRKGYEAELAYRFDLPLVAGAGGRQLFPWVAPAIRFSRLDPGFSAPAVTPSPSFAWPWNKIDLGLRLAVLEGIDVTAEYSLNEFTLGSGAEASNDELLVTLRWRTP